jgi:hypothetical protein
VHRAACGASATVSSVNGAAGSAVGRACTQVPAS